MRRNPKVAHYTDEQEAELKQTEVTFARAQIMERGVAETLKCNDHYATCDIEVAARVLAECVALRKNAHIRRREILAVGEPNHLPQRKSPRRKTR